MKKFSLILLSIVFTVSASVAGYCSEAIVSTNHWYPGRLPAGYSEYMLAFDVRGESISSVTVTGPNVPSTPLKYEKKLDSGEWRWYATVMLPGKPSVGDTYTFTVTHNDSSKEVLSDSVSGTVEEFPTIISPVDGSTIMTTRPVFKWTAFTTKLRSIDIIVADPELGDLIWIGDIPINDTSAVYNFDGKGKPLQAGKKYIWILHYRDEQDDKAAFIMSEFTVSADATPPTISGNISYTGAQTGTIVVAAFSNLNFEHDPSAMIQLDSPGSFTIPDLADGTYYMVSVIFTRGMENSIQKTDPWGVYGTLGNPTPVTITGGKGVFGVDIILVDGTEENPNPFQEVYSVSAYSQNGNYGNNYMVHFEVEDSDHEATSVKVTGPGITGSLSLDYDNDNNEKDWNSWHTNKSLNFGSSPPTPPLTYTFTIVYPESTTVKTDVVESFVSVYATDLSPSKGDTITGPLTFSWRGVGSGYTYRVELHDAQWNQVWDSDDLRTTSIRYDGPALRSDAEYSYSVEVKDAYGNSSSADESFVYHTVETGSISGTVSYTGSQTGKIIVAAFTNPDFRGGGDQGGSEPTVIELGSPGGYTIPGLADGTYYIASAMTTGGEQDGLEIKKTDPWGVYGTWGNLTPVTITGGNGVPGIDITLVDGTEENPNPFFYESGAPDITTQLPEITKAGVDPSITSDGSSVYLFKGDYAGASSAKVYKINPYSGEVITTYLLSLNNLANGICWLGSMTWHKSAIWVEGGYGDPSGGGEKVGIFKIDLGTSKSSNQIPAGQGIDLGGGGISGLASDGINLYVGVDLMAAVPYDLGIVKFDPGKVSEIPTSQFFLLDDKPEHLSYGDNYLWVDLNSIKKINPVTGQIEASYDNIPSSAAELYFDKKLWMYDENDNTLKAYSPVGEAGAVEELNTLHPSVFSLSQNFPNPFNPVTTIEFSVPRSEFVTLKVFNTLGEEVAVLVDREVSSGNHTIAWDASGFASGLYFYRLEAGSTILTKKLLLLK